MPIGEPQPGTVHSIYPYWPQTTQPGYAPTWTSAPVLTPFRCSGFCENCALTFEVTGFTPDAAETALQAWRDNHTSRCPDRPDDTPETTP